MIPTFATALAADARHAEFRRTAAAAAAAAAAGDTTRRDSARRSRPLVRRQGNVRPA